MNANDTTSKFYDSITSILRPEDLTHEEFLLIKSLIKPEDSILDVGAGTGRHVIKLVESKNYRVTALEDSAMMLEILLSKLHNAQLDIINSNILKTHLTSSIFNLITLFWNTFNEICLTEEDAIKLLTKLKEALVPNGQILINIDDSKLIDPSKFDFKFEFSQDNSNYTYSWKTIEYDPEINTSVSQEQIFNDKDAYVTNITQRYWSLAEIIKLAKKVGLNIDLKKLKTSNELYIVLSQNNS